MRIAVVYYHTLGEAVNLIKILYLEIFEIKLNVCLETRLKFSLFVATY